MNSENLEKILAATVFLFFLCLLPAMRSTVIVDPDLPGHLRTGDLILAHHSVPRTESFAWPAMGKDLVAYSWLFELSVAKAFYAGGFKAVEAGQCLLTCSFFSALLLLLYLETRELYGAAFMMAIVGAGLSPLATPRPWLFTMLFFTVELGIVMKARRTGAKPLIWLLPLFALWANIHIQFIYGLFVLGLVALEASASTFLARKWQQSSVLSASVAWGALLGCCAATLLNPYGWKVYGVILEFSRMHALFMYVSELQAPQFRNFADYIALGAVAGVGVATGVKRKRSDPLLLVLCCVGAVFAFRSLRDTWFFLIPASIFLCFPLTTMEDATKPTLPVWAALFSSIAVLLVIVFGVDSRTLARDQAKLFPVAAADFIQANHLRGNLYNSFTWGGYLIWRLPESKVSMDGRANVHNDQRIERSVRTLHGAPEWAADPELNRADIVVIEKQSALCSLLTLDQRFHLVYQDELAAVFVPARSTR